MIYLLYFVIVLAVALMAMGLYLGNQALLAIDGILVLTLGFWIFLNGFSIYDNLITQAIGLVCIGIGGYILIMATMSMIEGD